MHSCTRLCLDAPSILTSTSRTQQIHRSTIILEIMFPMFSFPLGQYDIDPLFYGSAADSTNPDAAFTAVKSNCNVSSSRKHTQLRIFSHFLNKVTLETPAQEEQVGEVKCEHLSERFPRCGDGFGASPCQPQQCGTLMHLYPVLLFQVSHIVGKVPRHDVFHGLHLPRNLQNTGCGLAFHIAGFQQLCHLVGRFCWTYDSQRHPPIFRA
mmetsp:Transcript_161819/g.310801  ORF Transcript_161819/g.310801 Transcript_161819/m.310801 type:complete len:209 (-) Transcript_161819:644-1270(-)